MEEIFTIIIRIISLKTEVKWSRVKEKDIKSVKKLNFYTKHCLTCVVV